MAKKVTEPCNDEFDGSICKKQKGHGCKHIDGVVSKCGPVSWNDAGKARVLAERAAEAAQNAKK